MQHHEQKILNVRRLYDSGIPFFTKDALRRMASDLDTVKNTRNEKVLVAGLDGHSCEFLTEGGKVIPNQGPFFDENDHYIPEANVGIEGVWRGRISYIPINRLVQRPGVSYSVKQPEDEHYFPLTFEYWVDYRNQTTKEEVHEDPRLVRLPLHAARQTFERERALFQRGAQASELRSVLESYRQSSRLPTVQKVVAFACGSVSWKDNLSIRSSRQHALALFVRDYFAETQKSEVQCFAQEPDYKDVDYGILEDAAVGIKILEDPWGFIEVDDETVVVAFSPDVPVRQVVADIARPAMMFWNRGWDSTTHDTRGGLDPSLSIVPSDSTDPMAPRLADMLKCYWEHPLTTDEDLAFLCSAMYIHKPKGNVEEEVESTDAGMLSEKRGGE